MKRSLFTLALAGLALTVSAADFAPQVNSLIPRLADPTVPNRYSAQMELQSIAANASKPGNETDRAALAGILAGKAVDVAVPQPARVWIVRQLEYIGRGEAVPALTILLSGVDAELRECACRALEKNPDAKSAVVLRDTLRKGGDVKAKIAIIRALGVKRDAESVPVIAPLLKDPSLAGSAAKALGLIGTTGAVDALWRVVDTQPLAGESLVDAANTALSSGNRSGAAATAEKLIQSKLPSPIRAAGLALLAKADPNLAKPHIEAALQGGDVRLQKAGVDAAGTPELVALLPKLPGTAKTFALEALTTGSAAENAALDCVSDKDGTVRIAALETLGRIGAASSVPVLIKVAAGGTDAEKSAAAGALAVIKGSGAGEAVLKQAAEGDAGLRLAAINALSVRGEKAAVPVLVRIAGESDATLSKAALAAIGKFGGDEALDDLTKMVLAGKSGAKSALQSVANRSSNKAVVSRNLAAQVQSASGSQVVAILDVMSLVGGAESLDAVVKFANSGNEEVKDGAIRALCNWREFVGVQPLLEVAGRQGVKLAHQVLAIQAVCRLVKLEEDKPAAARVEAVLGALKVASRDEEKRQVLSALASVPDKKAADAILALLADSTVRVDAANAALALAKLFGKTNRPIVTQLAEAVKNAAISPELTKQADQLLNKTGGKEKGGGSGTKKK